MKAAIKDIAYFLPEQVVDNEMLASENLEWEMERLAKSSGVYKRHIAGADESALDLAHEACKRLFADHPEIREKIDAILFSTQTPDHIIPSNACILHGRLSLSENVLALDFNLGCSGFIHGLALARGLILGNSAKNILLVTSDTYSKYIHKNDRSSRVLFGDGAAVTWIAATEGDAEILDVSSCTAGAHYQRFIIPAAGCRLPKSPETAVETTDESGNRRTLENIYMDGMGILKFVNSRVPNDIRSLLKKNEMTLDDIGLVVFHQASKMAIDSLRRLLKLKREKVYENYAEIGNTVSASIPIALKDAIEEGKIQTGDAVLLSGFGTGLSWGSALVRF